MSSILNWPSKRIEKSGVNNPRFVSDIVNGDENLIEVLALGLGLSNTDFAVISGLEYNNGNYTSGIVFMGGLFYKVPAGIGNYINPAPEDVLSKPFSDGNEYPTYRSFKAVWSSVSATGGSPLITDTVIQSSILNLLNIRNTINQKAYILNGTDDRTIALSGETHNIIGDATYIKLSTTGTTGTINYSLLSGSIAKFIVFDVFADTSDSTYFNLIVPNGPGTKIIKSVHFGVSHGAKYVFLKVTDSAWVELTSFNIL